jgi:outer membrane protein
MIFKKYCDGLLKLLILVAAATCFSAHAQTECSNPILPKNASLATLINLALSCNPNTHIAWSQMQVAAANVGIATGPYWPQISAGINATNVYRASNNNTNNNSGSKSSTAPNLTYGPSITVTYLLWDFGVTRQQREAAKLQWMVSQFNHNEVVQQTILQVEQAYYLTLAQKALAHAAIQTLKEYKTNLQAANALHQQGLNTIGDIYQAQSAYAQAQLNAQQIAGNYAIAKGQLNTALGIPIYTDLQLQALPAKEPTTAIFTDIKKQLDYALNNRPSLLAARSQVETNRALLAAAEDSVWPTIQFSATVGQSYPTSATNKGYSRSAALGMTIPLFVGFTQVYAQKRAEANLDIAVGQANSTANQVALEVWQAYNNLVTAKQTLGSSHFLLTSSLQAVRQASGQYSAGAGNILTVLTAEASAANARAQVIQANLNWYISLAQLSAALGTL